MASASENTSEKKMVILKSSDGETFEVEHAIAIQSQTIKHMIDDNCADESGIPMPNVTGRIMAKVIEYCKKHLEAESIEGKPSDDEFQKFDEEFVKVDQNTLFDLILAANFLDIKSLLDLTCKTVATMMMNKNPDEIRKIFHIVNDYSAEEEEEVRRENQWAFE